MRLILCCTYLVFFFECTGDHRDLHVLTYSCPTRRASDLAGGGKALRDRPEHRRRGREINPDRALHPVAEQRREIVVASALPRIDGAIVDPVEEAVDRSEEHTSELQSLMRISYAVFCLKKKKPQCANLRHYITNTIS